MSKTIALTLTRIHYGGSATLVTFFDLLNQQYWWVSGQTGRRWLSFMKLDKLNAVSKLKRLYNNSSTWQRCETRKTKIVCLLVSNPPLIIYSSRERVSVQQGRICVHLYATVFGTLKSCVYPGFYTKPFIFDRSVGQTLWNSPQPHSRNTALSLPGRVLLRKIFTSIRYRMTPSRAIQENDARKR